MFARNKLAMLVAEFLGTGILTLVVLSIQRSQLGGLAFFVAVAAGLAVALLTYIFSNKSGGHFNPALTLALWSARRVKTLPALAYIAAQLLGAWAGYGLYRYFQANEVQEIAQDFNGRILVAEAIGTMIFALAWAAAAYNRYETGRFAAVAGLSFTLAIIVASAASIGLANPALAEGVRAWDVFGDNGWGNYVLGPVLGAIIGVNLYGLLFDDSARPLRFSGIGRRRFGSRVSSRSSVTTVEEADDEDEEVVSEKPETATKESSVGAVSATKVKKAAAKKAGGKKKRS